MEDADFPKGSVKTLSSRTLEIVIEFWKRFFSAVPRIDELEPVTHSSLRSRISAGGMNEAPPGPCGTCSPCVWHPGNPFSGLLPASRILGCVRIGLTPFCSKILNTGIQYFPVDSIQTSCTPCSFNPCGHGADVAVHRCKLPDKKCCLRGFRVGLADSGHQDFLMDVNARRKWGV